MRALVNTRAGGTGVLRVEERPTPRPSPGEVLIRVSRAGLNFADLAARVGLYPDAPPFPMVVGYEVAGTIEALEAPAPGLEPGHRVVALCRFGGHATHVCVPATQVRRLPDTLGFDLAAALPVNGLTALHMLFSVAPLRPGMKVLIHSAAGGVGVCAIQLAKTVRDVELFGTASASKHGFLRELGLHHPIDPRTHDYPTEVRRLTHGRGLDRVFDALGGPDWEKGYGLLRPGGHLVCFGWANMVDGPRRNLLTIAREFLGMPRYTPMRLMNDNRSVSGVNLGHLWGEVDLLGPLLDALVDHAVAGRLVPHLDSVYPLARAAEAHARLQSRQSIGKVLLDCETA